jgi:transposase
MSFTELKRAEVLARVRAHTLSLRDASTLMGLSYRQTRRVWKRFRRGGTIALRHRSAGRRSPHRKRAAFKHRVLTLIRRHFLGDADHEPFGPTLIAEHLLEEFELRVDAETVRRWMLAQGLWRRARQAPKHRRRRACKAHFGELVQLDGSFEPWLEDRGPEACLMDMVDDATNRVGLRFEPQETIWGAVRSLRAWIGQYGIPRALYTDWKNVYVRKPTEAELASDEPARTQFGRMCATLGIRIIAASSPQAKGRVERGNGTHQDRLVKKLRRVGIAAYDTANQFLECTYVPGHNARFSHPPASPEDFHTPVPPAVDLAQVFRLETTRTVNHDWVVRYDNRLLQLERQGRFYPPAHSTVLVCEYEDGHLEVWYRERRVPWTEITGTARRHPGRSEHPVTPSHEAVPHAATARRPAANHPWRRGYGGLHDGVSPGEAIPGHPSRPVLLAASAGPALGRGACSAASSSTSI